VIETGEQKGNCANKKRQVTFLKSHSCLFKKGKSAFAEKNSERLEKR
jgi:hypothetical protein